MTVFGRTWNQKTIYIIPGFTALLWILKEKQFRLKKHSNTSRLMQWLYMPGLKAINWNKNDLLKLKKPKWPPQPRFQSHMKTDKTNRFVDPANYQVWREFWKKSCKNIFATWRPFWLSVESWKSNQVSSILMGNFTYKVGSNNYF